MALTFRIGLLAIAVSVCGRLTLAQDAACDKRIVPVRVESADGTVIQDFTAADLVAKVGGRDAVVTSVRPDTRPHRILLLIDASGSMRAGWDRAMWLALGFAKDSLPGSEVGLILFNEKVIDEVPFSAGRAAVIEKVRQLKSDSSRARGSTALYSALEEGLRTMDSPSSADALYVIGDVEDNASEARVGKTLDVLAAAGVRIFIALVADGEERKRDTRAARFVAGELARRTGGEVLDPFVDGVGRGEKGVERFAERMNAFHRRMITQSLMELGITTSPEKRASLEVHLSREAANRLKAVRVAYPAELTACRSVEKNK